MVKRTVKPSSALITLLSSTRPPTRSRCSGENCRSLSVLGSWKKTSVSSSAVSTKPAARPSAPSPPAQKDQPPVLALHAGAFCSPSRSPSPSAARRRRAFRLKGPERLLSRAHGADAQHEERDHDCSRGAEGRPHISGIAAHLEEGHCPAPTRRRRRTHVDAPGQSRYPAMDIVCGASFADIKALAGPLLAGPRCASILARGGWRLRHGWLDWTHREAVFGGDGMAYWLLKSEPGSWSRGRSGARQRHRVGWRAQSSGEQQHEGHEGGRPLLLLPLGQCKGDRRRRRGRKGALPGPDRTRPGASAWSTSRPCSRWGSRSR